MSTTNPSSSPTDSGGSVNPQPPANPYSFTVDLDQWVWDAFYTQPNYPPKPPTKD